MSSEHPSNAPQKLPFDRSVWARTKNAPFSYLYVTFELSVIVEMACLLAIIYDDIISSCGLFLYTYRQTFSHTFAGLGTPHQTFWKLILSSAMHWWRERQMSRTNTRKVFISSCWISAHKLFRSHYVQFILNTQQKQSGCLKWNIILAYILRVFYVATHASRTVHCEYQVDSLGINRSNRARSGHRRSCTRLGESHVTGWSTRWEFNKPRWHTYFHLYYRLSI